MAPFKGDYFLSSFALRRSSDPIDTHRDNQVMRERILRNGFQECGIIYLENGDPRIAYELLPTE